MAAKKTAKKAAPKKPTEPKKPVFSTVPLWAEDVPVRVSWALQQLVAEIESAFPATLVRYEGHNIYHVCIDIAVNVKSGDPAEPVLALLGEDPRVSDVERTDENTLKVHLRDIMASYDIRDEFGIAGAANILDGGE